MFDRNGRVHWTMRCERMMAVFGVLAVTLSGACAHSEQFHELVEERAAFDLQCEDGSLEVIELPGLAYGVRGCGQQATYVMTGASCQNPKQLAKREVGIYCTPVLDHSAARAEAEIEPDEEQGPASEEPEPEPESSEQGEE